MKIHMARGTRLAFSTLCGLLAVMLSGCQSGSQASMKPADIQSAVGKPGQARPEITPEAKANRAKGEQMARDMLAQHTSAEAAPEGRPEKP